MYKANHLLYLTSILTALLSAPCSASTPETEPYFNPNNQSGAFFDKTLILNSTSDFVATQEKNWDFATELKHEKLGAKTASSCLQLKKLIAEGFAATKAYEHAFVSAQSAICSMWKLVEKFKPYTTSFISELTFNQDFSLQVPARFALLISNDDIKKAESASNWNDMSKIKQVKSLNPKQAIFYDDSGSIQRLTLMAKGDYNADGIEDRLFFVENSVEGGSYSSTKIFIITRLSTDEPIRLLEEI